MGLGFRCLGLRSRGLNHQHIPLVTLVDLQQEQFNVAPILHASTLHVEFCKLGSRFRSPKEYGTRITRTLKRGAII